MEGVPHIHLIRVKMFWVTVLLSVAVLVSFSLAAWSFKTSHDAGKRERKILCAAENKSNDAMRKVLRLAQSLGRHNRPPGEQAAAEDFYRRALRLVGPVPCSGSN